MMSHQSNLSKNDSAVLSQLFDPESAPTSGVLIDPSLPPDPVIRNLDLLTAITIKKQEIIREVESVMKESPTSQRRANVLSRSIVKLDALITEHPNAASLMNDRAQVFRLQYGDNIIVSTKDNPVTQHTAEHVSKILEQLDKVIQLLKPSTPQSAVSPAQCRTLAQAHTQRGALYHRAAKALSSQTEDNCANVMIESLRAWRAIDFEEAASRDFFMGGRYGNEIGKALAVHTNPTAKLCGQIVQDAMRRELVPQD